MRFRSNITRFGAAGVLATVLSLSPKSMAQQVGFETGFDNDRIVIRQTIPDPYAVRRSPLTSDRLSTTSTRLIDARRGFRPYSSVYGDSIGYQRYADYDDHFGISRPENRPWSYSQRTPRTSVTQFRNSTRSIDRVDINSRRQASPAYTLVLRDQARMNEPKPNMKIRIHKDKTAVPTTSGAVLITSDGIVIQVGD